MSFLLKRSSLRFFLALSFSLHLVLALLVFVFSSAFFFQKKVLIIENAIQVDSIKLADLKKISSSNFKDNSFLSPPLLPEKKAIKKVAKPKTRSKITAKTKTKSKVKTPKKERQAKIQQEKNLNKKEPKKTALAENQNETESSGSLSNSPSDSPSSSQLSEGQISEISYYAGQILRQIRKNWNLPSYLANKDLTTQVEIKIAENGGIIYQKIILSSGNDLYDSFVLKTIEKGSPYLRPSPSVQKIIQNGIVLNVPSQ